MIKNITVVATLAGVLMIGSPVLATPNLYSAELSTRGTERTLVLPEAAGHSSVISLGEAVDPQSGNVVEGFAIIRKHKHAKPDNPGGGKGGGKDKPAQSSCYEFLAKDAKWKNVEPWIVNGANTRGLSETFVYDNLVSDITKWEDAAGVDILGDGSMTSAALLADEVSPDGANEVYFADIASDGAIGVTIVWGIFGGKPSARELVEWDQVYDDVDFDWSASGEAGKMDFESIATHELGHSVGLGDLYEASCADETMYGYATEGETLKRDLHTGDIAGITELY